MPGFSYDLPPVWPVDADDEEPVVPPDAELRDEGVVDAGREEPGRGGI